jgi:magnesium transporter
MSKVRRMRRRHAYHTALEHLEKAPTVLATATAGAARVAALNHRIDGANVYCLNTHGKLVGVLHVTALLGLSDSERVEDHMLAAPPCVRADADQETVAQAAIRLGLSAIPVEDEQGRFTGVVPATALLRVLRFEHHEDLDRLSGVLRRVERVTRAADESPSRRVMERLPWLLVGLVGSAIAAWVVSHFEATLEREVTAAFFIPGIVYLADAIGTQTETVAVRGLAQSLVNPAKTFWKELGTGLLLGSILALLVLPAIWVTFGDLRLAVSVALATLTAGTVAAVVGFAFPLALFRLGWDPALGSGPLATVVQDVLSLLAYFYSVQWVKW